MLITTAIASDDRMCTDFISMLKIDNSIAHALYVIFIFGQTIRLTTWFTLESLPVFKPNTCRVAFAHSVFTNSSTQTEKSVAPENIKLSIEKNL